MSMNLTKGRREQNGETFTTNVFPSGRLRAGSGKFQFRTVTTRIVPDSGLGRGKLRIWAVAGSLFVKVIKRQAPAKRAQQAQPFQENGDPEKCGGDNMRRTNRAATQGRGVLLDMRKERHDIEYRMGAGLGHQEIRVGAVTTRMLPQLHEMEFREISLSRTPRL
ncbi:hypothetical protein BKA67DRAFT_540329 [Truncatella angustata]|uniref:Uncharacterized protein n=1 Tax=Truncatella angustata TaxID=152316 RepID=A0A9P8RMB4_9PEZI|nr:uncharacterized protein BKA67DRAFT_540329 [Truncatella angustata]KAH6646858.1 hypothetical protein BKA67DRAFT_540329 [Truncatella angustata]